MTRAFTLCNRDLALNCSEQRAIWLHETCDDIVALFRNDVVPSPFEDGFELAVITRLQEKQYDPFVDLLLFDGSPFAVVRMLLCCKLVYPATWVLVYNEHEKRYIRKSI